MFDGLIAYQNFMAQGDDRWRPCLKSFQAGDSFESFGTGVPARPYFPFNAKLLRPFFHTSGFGLAIANINS